MTSVHRKPKFYSLMAKGWWNDRIRILQGWGKIMIIIIILYPATRPADAGLWYTCRRNYHQPSDRKIVLQRKSLGSNSEWTTGSCNHMVEVVGSSRNSGKFINIQCNLQSRPGPDRIVWTLWEIFFCSGLNGPNFYVNKENDLIRKYTHPPKKKKKTVSDHRAKWSFTKCF